MQINNIHKIESVIIKQGMLPLFYHAEELVSIAAARAIYKAGVRALEYTHRGDQAFNNFQKMVSVRNIDMPDLLLGAGTIKNLKQAEEYVDAGADFLISPGFVSEIAAYACKRKIFYAPGCMTPTEILIAEKAGIGFIKLFPGSMLGPQFISAVKDIFPKLNFMPTGGLETSEENLKNWFDAGVCAVGLGSQLISKKMLEAKDYASLEKDTRKVLDLISSIKE